LCVEPSPIGRRRASANSTVARVIRQTMAEKMGLSSAKVDGTVEVR
jgi:hypothetical protein